MLRLLQLISGDAGWGLLVAAVAFGIAVVLFSKSLGVIVICLLAGAGLIFLSTLRTKAQQVEERNATKSALLAINYGMGIEECRKMIKRMFQ